VTNPLKERIVRLIGTAGPITVADYMATCLFDPEHGYYTTREPFGVKGDFTTAPEISQMFGEIIGAWLVHAWRLLDRPAPFALVEIGPGRGTLMRDVLRTARIDPDFRNSARIFLVENSPRLTAIQRETLGEDAEHVTWTDDVSALPAMPALMVANELFDAIPFRQVRKTAAGWCERMVGLDSDGRLTFVDSVTGVDPVILPAGADDRPEGAIFEFAPAREALASKIGEHIATHRGAALWIDYGHAEPGFGDTFQALRAHRPAGVFETPGECDLTSHVDFAALADAAASAGAHAFPVMTQGGFLLSLGLAERAGALGAGKDAATQDAISRAVGRLAGMQGDEMGRLFKVLCVAGSPLALPPFS
jgi:SAM-dependent MidA family methyltransferase